MTNNTDKKNWSMIAILKGVGIGIAISFILLLLFGGVATYFLARLHTEYAPNYSHNKFKQVKVGMSEPEVLALIGEPFERTPDRSCWLVERGEECAVVSPKSTWYYSQQDETDTDYFVRNLEMENGKVTRVVKSFYGD